MKGKWRDWEEGMECVVVSACKMRKKCFLNKLKLKIMKYART